MKGSALVDTMSRSCWSTTPVCADGPWPAPRPSGDPVAIAAYLGARRRFDLAITDFAKRYADQNESDHQALPRPP